MLTGGALIVALKGRWRARRARGRYAALLDSVPGTASPLLFHSCLGQTNRITLSNIYHSILLHENCPVGTLR